MTPAVDGAPTPRPDSSAAADPLAPYDAVLLLSYGGPEGPDDVLPFMRNATAGRGVPDSRLREVSGHYSRWGGVSPINARNAELLAALREELAARGSRVPVVIGNRNWHPFVSEALRELADGGARRVLAITTAAYASYSGCRQYREDVSGALELLGAGEDGSTGRGREADAAARVGGAGGAPVELVVDKTRPFYNTPGMLAANTDAIVAAFNQLVADGVSADGIRLALVTHSIPESMERLSAPTAEERESGGVGELSSGGERADSVGFGSPTVTGRVGEAPEGVAGLAGAARGTSGADGSRGGLPHPSLPEPGVAADLSTEISYIAQHERLAEVLLEAVAARLGRRPQVDLVYCSRSGPPQARWLEPDVNDHLQALAAGRLTDGRAVEVPTGVVVAPIGFVADHMEVVFDLDTEARETAARLDLPYVRAATAGTHPAFVASLADVLAERAAVARGQDVRPESTTGTGPFHTVCPPTCCRPATRPPAHAPRRPPQIATANNPDRRRTP
ncbi:ferrochelatase [Actinomyces ruminicola]|uniref:coproporphyrin ferrochelatase n=1 Tax=Actinomyces ruminicola TaxID=332524 RepID=A0A1H0AVA5_9ACTO|nr:ferrochelatase [Actinomyces ruminicola]SDN37106.1 ferrochelatase [Actinomyces ruminicola]